MKIFNHLKIWTIKNKQSLIFRFLLKNKWLIMGLVAIIFINYFYLNKIFSIHFVDEEDNLVLGHFLLNGQKLYSDLFSHHQPLAYIFSAAFQLVTQPENIFMLIKRHREFMIAYSLFWSAILIWRFKEKIILPLIIYEVSKFFLLGQLFLSESLAVYPILYLILFLFEKSRFNKYELAIIGFLMSLTALLLAPAWPFLAALFIFLFWYKKVEIKNLWLIVSGALPLILISLPFIDIYYYFRNIFYINFKYYIPQSGEAKFPSSLLLAFISPLTALLTKSDIYSVGFILKVICAIFAAGLTLQVKNKNFKLIFVALTLLTLSNIRYYTPGLQYYAGFHTLIWYGIFILLSCYFFTEFLKISNKTIKIFSIIFLVVAVAATFLFSKDLFKKNDLDYDYYVNYSENFAYGEVIKAMRNESDTLFIIEDEWLLYFQGDVKNNNRMVNFYGWMSLVWELADPVAEKFKSDPPTFFYCECEETTVYAYSGDYTQLIRDGAKTPLWIHNTKYQSLTDPQKDKLHFFHFQLN